MEGKTEKIDAVRSELMTSITADYDGKSSWKKQFFEDVELKKEELAVTRYVSRRKSRILCFIEKFWPILIAFVLIFMLYFAMFTYQCYNNKHCSYEFDDRSFTSSFCNYLGTKRVN